MTQLQIAERNTELYAMCPNCSKHHLVQNREGDHELPRLCSRCKCPMDPGQARPWQERQTELAHDPKLTALGQRMRGEQPEQEATLARLLGAIEGLTNRIEALESRPVLRRARQDAD